MRGMLSEIGLVDATTQAKLTFYRIFSLELLRLIPRIATSDVLPRRLPSCNLLPLPDPFGSMNSTGP
ncbi:hypothetical protein ANAPRD1_01300 [Anaplasma phagocytophilum]|nr:hypothetical protein ANAPC5_01495 [Anaplasma phagocytophilum]SCV66783.1 hypothetical protein ANAPRD1_01300 [Anaplasma phagocytophilum]